MAKSKKPDMSNIFAKTDIPPELQTDLKSAVESPEEKLTPRGVKLSRDELARLDKIAGELGVSRHELLRHAVLQFMANWDKGVRPGIVSKGVKLETT